MKTPADKRITLTMYSHPMKDVKLRWKAQLVFEPGSVDDTMAKISFVDGEGNPIEEGVFEFAGQHLEVRDGNAYMRCGDFVKGKHEPGIWLHRAKHAPIPGALTFE